MSKKHLNLVIVVSWRRGEEIEIEVMGDQMRQQRDSERRRLK